MFDDVSKKKKKKKEEKKQSPNVLLFRGAAEQTKVTAKCKYYYSYCDYKYINKPIDFLNETRMNTSMWNNLCISRWLYWCWCW